METPLIHRGRINPSRVHCYIHPAENTRDFQPTWHNSLLYRMPKDFTFTLIEEHPVQERYILVLDIPAFRSLVCNVTMKYSFLTEVSIHRPQHLTLSRKTMLYGPAEAHKADNII